VRNGSDVIDATQFSSTHPEILAPSNLRYYFWSST
jgi:hypothetical protein